MFGQGQQRMVLKLLNFLVLYNGIVLGATNTGVNKDIPFRPPTQSEIMMALEIADTKRDRFGVSSFSNHLHQIISILVSMITGGQIEPKSQSRFYDVLHDSYYIEIAANEDRIKKMPTSDPVIVLNKYSLAKEWGIPHSIVWLSMLEEDRRLDLSIYVPDSPKEGIFKSPEYIKDESFMSALVKPWSEVMLRKMAEPVKVESFDDFVPKEINPNNKFIRAISKIPFNYIMIDQSAAESVSESKITWIDHTSDIFEPFKLNNMKPNISASCRDGIWTLQDDDGDKIGLDGSKRYEITSDREFMLISRDYIKDIQTYCTRRDKNFGTILQKNYGNNLLQIDEPYLIPYTNVEWARSQIMDRQLPTDSNLWDFLNKCMPESARNILNKTHNCISQSTCFQESLFMRDVCTSIILHKKNTKSKRLLIKHKFMSLCAVVSIVGDITSSDVDSGFAHVRFHMNLNNRSLHDVDGYRVSRSPYHQNTYRYISQGFKLRKPDIMWYISAPEKMISLVYSTFEELHGFRLKYSAIEFSEMEKRCTNLIMCNLSILCRASWGYSRILKPFKYYIINVSQRSNFCYQTEKQLWDEITQYGGIIRYPEIHTFLLYVRMNILSHRSNPHLSPAFLLPVEMMGHEAFIMNLCPKQLYGRQRHSVSVFSKICEETDLYFDNLEIILKIRDDAQRIYLQHRRGITVDVHIVSAHINRVEQLSATTGIRFIYSPLSQCMIYDQLQEEVASGMSQYAGNIHHPSFPELLTTKGAFSTIMNKNCKALEGLTLMAKEISPLYPITTLNCAAYILDKIIHDPKSVPLLYAIVPKDQVGGDREISMMNEYLRILQCICESIAKHYGKLSGVDKLSDPNKDAEFYKLVMMDGPMFAFIGDQTRWGPNFNTIVFGDMFLLMKMCGFPCASLAHSICYLAQRKIFLCPENVEMSMLKVKHPSKDLRYTGVSAPSHMGEGIFHYSSSLYHAFVSKSFCRLISKLPGLSSFSTHMLVTSDDISYINKNISPSDIPILQNCYKGFQKFLTPMSIKTSTYKNMESEQYVEFNSIAIFPTRRTYLFQSLKQMVGNVMVPTTHTFWNDVSFAISSFNTILNSGGSFCMAYMVYLLNTTLAFRRWSMLRLFYINGYFRVLTPKQLIQNEPPFPREYHLRTENGQISIEKTGDSRAVFKFKTLERLTSSWDTLKDMSRHLNMFSEMRISGLKHSPEGNSTPLSRFILPSSFKERATIPIRLIPSAFKELKDLAIPDAPISIELAAVLSSQSWYKNKDEYHDLTIIRPQYEQKVSDEEYLSNIMSYLTMSLRTDTDIAPIMRRPEELTPAIHKLRSTTMPPLNSESVIVENFGSYYDGQAGIIHKAIIQLDGKGVKLASRLKESILRYFNTYQDIYTFVSNLIQQVDEALTKSSLRITGLYTKDKNVLYANFQRGHLVNSRIVKTSLTIPMSYIFEDPVISYKINKRTTGIPFNTDRMFLITNDNQMSEVFIENLSMAQDSGDRIVKNMSTGPIFYKKSGISTYLPLSALANYADPLAIPSEDLRVVIIESNGFFSPTIHVNSDNDFMSELLSIDEIMSKLTDGSLDTSSIQAFAVDNVLDKSQRRIATEETKENLEIEQPEDPFQMFFDKENKSHDVSIESRVIEITDDMIKKLIIACRDGYFLKYCMASWISDPNSELFEDHFVPEINNHAKVFQSKAVASAYSRVNARAGQLKYPNELRVLASQIFESPPMIKSKFTREKDTLYISASILKLAQLSAEMYNSSDWSVSNMYTVPLLIISSLFGT